MKLSGAALIIDEQVFHQDRKDLIHNIVDSLKKNNIPVLLCDDLNSAELMINNVTNIRFIIMDWNLKDLPIDVAVPYDINTDSNIDFLNKLKEKCFAPVFILSSEDPKSIESSLSTRGNGIYELEKPYRNFIFISSKSKVSTAEELLKNIEEWVKLNPTISVLKSWEDDFARSKNVVFWQLFSQNPNWVSILWETFKTDDVDESSNLYDIISRVINGCISKTNIREDEIVIKGYKPNTEEIAKVIAGSMYIAGKYLPQDEISPGDIFESEGKYWINIRPECDLVPRNGTLVKDVEVFLLKCDLVKDKKIFKRYYDNENEKYGLQQKSNSFCILGGNGTFFEVKYKQSIRATKFGTLNRVSRLLHPYVSYLQQGYASYISRTGLPRVPDVLLKDYYQSLK